MRPWNYDEVIFPDDLLSSKIKQEMEKVVRKAIYDAMNKFIKNRYKKQPKRRIKP